SIATKLRGNPVPRITLFVFGGVSELIVGNRMPTNFDVVSPDLTLGAVVTYDICVFQNANPRQSLRLFGGDGGNRKHWISPRIRQVRVITGNRIPS
ncbi:MAG: hypothetical protein ACERNK_13945, partial [Deltaproteobacteria bacterium]